MFVMYLAFIQAAIGSGDLSQIVQVAAGALLVGVGGWVIKVTRDVSRAITRLTDCLFGYTGTKGLVRDVDMLRVDVDELLDRRGRRRDDREVMREDLP